jgi:hypothetical protein
MLRRIFGPLEGRLDRGVEKPTKLGALYSSPNVIQVTK